MHFNEIEIDTEVKEIVSTNLKEHYTFLPRQNKELITNIFKVQILGSILHFILAERYYILVFAQS